jgi:hypothetical protein
MVNGLLLWAWQGGKICRVDGFAGMNLPVGPPHHSANPLI